MQIIQKIAYRLWFRYGQDLKGMIEKDDVRIFLDICLWTDDMGQFEKVRLFLIDHAISKGFHYR